MKKVSVIVPVYNAAEFLAETLDSILNQTLEDIEVIAVNDGSLDESLEILEVYAQQDERLMVLNQENGGPSAARNNALGHAQGEYVLFFDSDDLLCNTSLEKMYDRAKKMDADLVIGKYDIFNGVVYSPINNINSIVQKDVVDKYDKSILWTFSLWNKLFKRSVIEENSMRFEPISYSEDGVFTMRFVHAAKLITGCNAVIMHYRRMPFARHAAITATVSSWKIQDYLTAHRLIYLGLKETMCKDFPQYSDFGELLRKEDEMHQYINEFLKKEITILLNQFYKKFWGIDEETLLMLVRTIQGLLNKVNLDIYYQLAAKFPEFYFDHLYTNYAEAMSDCRVAVVLFGKEERSEQFLRCLRSLCVQNFVQLNIYVPAIMEEYIRKEELIQDNIVLIECMSQADLNRIVLENTSAEYILFADDAFSYEGGALNRMYNDIRNMRLDMFDAVVNIDIDDKAVLCSWHGKAINGMKNRRAFAEYSRRDALLANKLIAVDFLRTLQSDFMGNPAELAEKLLRKAYFAVTQKVNVIFRDGVEDAAFIDYLKKIGGSYFDGIEYAESINSLLDPRIENNMGEVYNKLMPSSLKKKKNQKKRMLINWISRLPVKNKVLFYSIRKDGELEGNLKAIYDFVDGRKVICSQKLPHSQLWKLRMYYEFATSKVIIVDDYARYLRLFPLKPRQRVVQLWHACGAFKKFGIHGTNLPMRVEKSTHIQYNLVCVSAENIRQTYASAFDIDVIKVNALGVPRTDVYFDTDMIREKKYEILKKYPELEDKRIILYAPTFRDRNAERTAFKPEMDFDDLSRRLGQKMVFIIAPHPVMTEPILQCEYDNIKEIRDISTGDLMFVSDVMVTDYSSVIFEYALLNRPIAFYCYDKDIYDRGFYLDFDNDLPGDIFQTYDAFVDYIEHPEKQVVTEKHHQFIEKYMSACDGHSRERIAGIINDYMEADE